MIDFPSSPNDGELYEYGDRTWQYRTNRWVLLADVPAPTWKTVFYESGASDTTLVASSGTWASNGTEIECSTSSGEQNAYFSTPTLDASEYLIELEVQYGDGNGYIGPGFARNSGSDVSGALEINAHSNSMYVVKHGITLAANVAFPMSNSTWYRWRFHVVGSVAVLYCDDVYVGTLLVDTLKAGNQLNLRSYATTSLWRNITVKVPAVFPGTSQSPTPYYENPWIDPPPSAPHSMNDEFNDPDLASKWTIAKDSTTDWYLTSSHIVVENGALGIVQAAPSGNWTATAKIRGPHQTNGTGVGVVISDDNGTGGHQKLAHIIAGGGVVYANNNRYASWAYAGDGTYVTVNGKAPSYVRMRFDGATYYQEYSVDGLGWEAIGTGIDLVSPVSYLGLLIYPAEAGMFAAVDWFRVT